MNHEDELLALVDDFGRTQFKAGELRAAIARHVATIAILRDAVGEVRRPAPVGPSPGPTRHEPPIVLEQPPQTPRFSKPRVPLPRKVNNAGPNAPKGTARAPVFEPEYRPPQHSPAWLLEQALIAEGGRARRLTIYAAVKAQMFIPETRFNKYVCELRMRGVLVPFLDTEEGIIEFTPQYRALIEPAAGSAVAS